MKPLIICAISVIAVFSSPFAFSQPKGLKFTPESGARYVDSMDPKVGPITIDSAQGITWMRCAVGQEIESDASKECVGNLDSMTFKDIAPFAKKIGPGWRLPTLWEVKGANEHVMKALAKGKRAQPGKYGGGGWDCEGLGIWTSTGVTGMPNAINLAICTGFTSGNNIKDSAVDKFGDTRAPLMLVR